MTKDIVRSEATYRVSFPMAEPGRSIPALSVLAQRLTDILETFEPVEMRVLPETIDVYVTVPVDVMPEAIDRKAQMLRAKWGA